MAFKFVEKLPEGVKKQTGNNIFTDDLIDALRENEGKWALVEEATGQGAAAWKKRMDKIEKGFEYRSVDTGKPDGKPRKAPKNPEVTYQPTKKDIYVRFNPSKSASDSGEQSGEEGTE